MRIDMFTKLQALNTTTHTNFRVLPNESFDYASKVHLIKLMTPEFPKACLSAPIVFIEESSSEGFVPVMLMGLEQDTNVFVDQNGKWTGSYIPALIRRYPFTLVKTDDDQLVICFDEESGLVIESEESTTKDKGEGAATVAVAKALFEEGEPTAVLKNIQSFLTEVHSMELHTDAFAQEMASKNLLTPININISGVDGQRNIQGCFTINEERLNKLSNDTFISFKEKGYLASIYSQLISLQSLYKLNPKTESGRS